MSQDSIDTNSIHHRAQMLVMARLVDAKNHIRELKVWMRVQYIVCIVVSCVAICVAALFFLGAPIPYFTLFIVCISLALWLKYFMLMYHQRYHELQLKRAQHAMQTLNDHHYTAEQHADVIKKRA